MPISLDEFRELVDTHGPYVAQWPTDKRQAAEGLVLASLEAREIIARAAELEAALRTVPPVRAPAGLLDRICQAVAEHEDEANSLPSVLSGE